MEVGDIEVAAKTYTIRNRNRRMIVESPLSISPDVQIELYREEIVVDESATPDVQVQIPEHVDKRYSFVKRASEIAAIEVTLQGVTMNGNQIMGFVEALTDEVNRRETDSEAPTIPADLTATAYDSGRIDLAWTASTDNVGVQEYVIYQNGERIASTEEISYSVTGLTPETEYSFTVKAKDAKGNTSDASTAATATTEAAPLPEE